MKHDSVRIVLVRIFASPTIHLKNNDTYMYNKCPIHLKMNIII